MVKLKIDNKNIEVAEGTKLIEAARSNGIFIPSLCYNKDLPHYTSCMVCMVKDITSGKYIPSCSAKVKEGQIINASGEEVVSLRQDALSLLLTEHRAECEAPCKNVCPAAYNIPLINRHLENNELQEAYNTINESIKLYGFACIECSAPCEKACRRKMIDTSISIRSLLIYLHNNNAPSGELKVFKRTEPNKKFNSTIGRIEDGEKLEWLKECKGNKTRYPDPATDDEISSEAASCMHCDCRAADDCNLRQLCDLMDIKNPRRIRTGPPIYKKINSESGLIFENAKCIKCGLCVRAVQDSTNNPALCFTGRGFMSLISEPKTLEFDSILSGKVNEVVAVCPTGALSIMK